MNTWTGSSFPVTKSLFKNIFWGLIWSREPLNAVSNGAKCHPSDSVVEGAVPASVYFVTTINYVETENDTKVNVFTFPPLMTQLLV